MISPCFLINKDIEMVFSGWQGIATFLGMVAIVIVAIYAFAKKIE